jgi:hypothetical protein
VADCRDILLLLSRFRFRDPINTFHPSPEKKEKRSGGAQKEKKRKEKKEEG